jgi:hypothetical protein
VVAKLAVGYASRVPLRVPIGVPWARLRVPDMAARSDELKAKLQAAPDWDLVICDEAHRMAASYFGGENPVCRIS